MCLLGVYSMDHCFSKILTALGQRSWSVYAPRRNMKQNEMNFHKEGRPRLFCTHPLLKESGQGMSMYVTARFVTAMQSRHCGNECHNDTSLDKQIIICLPTRFYFSAREGSFALPVNSSCHRVGKPFFAPQCDTPKDLPSASQSSPKVGGILNNMKGYTNTPWENEFTQKTG